ncbi:GMC family oxidoreductase [Lysinibacillus sp. SGAir0095]|uniref:GMC family oxidoreductase n=1 Tax=Lysinibacillus sp. SGAir0095 TaxID=2070463 RepID=UPI0010CCF18D|nr:GMC family oxidoreductase [Lysinibacillus sp. SGAir0095]QCR32668.1 GMC family oxidoreductase [Lysinibacillus sp. SGAir0095]
MVTTLPKTDVVLIGVGWTGGILAAELTKKGYKVVGLERGKRRTTSDYLMVHDELRFALRYDLMQDLSKETVTFRNNEKMRALPMRQYGSFLLGTGLGGSGVHWNGQTWRFLPYDFQIRTLTEERYGKNKIPAEMTLQDWGITYDELEPYFDKFEQMAGISGEENPFGGARSNKFPTPPMKVTPITGLFKEACANLGYKPFSQPSANLSEAYTNPDGIARAACQYCGFCERFGCEYGAKADPVVTVLPVAESSGKFDLRTNSNVVEILHEGNRATGVRFIDTQSGEEFIQPAEVVAVTSYVLNNVRLLLQSNIGKPYDPKTGTGVIGKNYAYQNMCANTTGFFEDKEFNVYAGAGSLGMSIDEFNGDNFDHSELNFIHGANISLSQLGKRPIQNNTVKPDTPSWGAKFKEESVKYQNRSISFNAQGASMPYRYHYLDLDPTYKDAFGNPLLRMTYDFQEQDNEMSKFMASKTEQIMKEMGASEVIVQREKGPYNIVPYQSTHNTGGVIMGDNPDTSALNSYLQMWDFENVFVPGASAFPHNSGYNPTGTVGALSYRAAEGIDLYLKNGGSLV